MLVRCHSSFAAISSELISHEASAEATAYSDNYVDLDVRLPTSGLNRVLREVQQQFT